MPRDSSGNYTLPGAYNPVVAGTTIQAAWANTTLPDVGQGLTDSLDRSGRGGMLAAFKGTDGAVGLPGITFTNETTTGLSRPAAGVIAFSILGVEEGRFTAAGLDVTALTIAGVPIGGAFLKLDGTSQMTGAVQGFAGTVALPGYSFVGDLNNGWWSPAADTQAWSTAGVQRMGLNAAGLGVGLSPGVAALSVAGGALATADYGLFAAVVSAGRLVSMTGTKLNALHSHFDDTILELSTGSGGGFRAGITIEGNVSGGSSLANSTRFWGEGVERARLTATQFGLFSTTPGARLGINSVGQSGIKVHFSQAVSANIFAEITHAGDSGGFQLKNINDSLDRGFRWYNGTATPGTERMQLDSSGRLMLDTTTVGISASASTFLTVGGNSAATYLSVKASGGAEALLVADASGILAGAFSNHLYDIRTNNTLRLRVTAAGLIQDGAGLELGFKGLPVASVTTGAFVLADRGKCVYATAGVTIPNATMAAEDTVIVQNTTGAGITITKTVTTAYNTNTGAALGATFTLGARGRMAVVFTSSTECYVSGNIT